MLKIILIIETITILSAAAYISKDYQDSWILEGLEIPFAVLMITYAVYLSIEKKTTWLIAFALICRSFILLIPNLKYEWFQGVYIDQHEQYRFAQHICSEGYTPSGRLYSGTPLIGLSFATYSIITNVPLLYSFKYFPIFFWFIYPLAIYLVMKTLEFTNSSLLKYALVVSSIPVKSAVSYLVTGTLFGALLTFLILLQLVKMLQKNDRRDLAIAVIYSLALVATHSYSSIMLMIALITTHFIIQLLRRMPMNGWIPKSTSLSVVLTVIVVNLSWLSFEASNILEIIVETELRYMKRLMGYEVIAGVSIPLRFFELGFIDGFKTIIVYHGGDILLTILTLIGVVIVAKKFHARSKPASTFLSLYVITLWLALAIGIFIFNFGEEWYDRLIRLLLAMSPIFSGVSLFYIDKKTRSTKLTTFIIMLLMLLATIELYHYQPLIPAASSISKDLPTDEPIIYVGLVNSIYQRCMIKHAERHIPQGTLIACDAVTTNQVIGLTSYNFSRACIWYYPFSILLEKSFTEIKYDYFLIHLPGKSGAFDEKAEIRTRSLILKALCNSSITYSNGESHMLTKPFMYEPRI